MNRRKNILKNTFKFMAYFILINIIFLIIFATSIMYTPTGMPMTKYAPISKEVDADKLDWNAIGDIGGRGILIDEKGRLIRSYVEKNEKTSYTKMELMDLFDLRGNDNSVFSYTTEDNNKLLIIYPKSVFDTVPSMNVNTVMGDKDNLFLVVIGLGLFLYIFLIYTIIKRLTKGLKKEFDLIRAEEDEKENIFFRGLAHDIKTPLSTIIAYSRALEDGIVEEGEEENYYESIYNNGILLKERVDDMLKLTALGDEGIFFPEEGDLLENIRRYAGDSYSWFAENQANINIEFDDKDSFITNYDSKLFKRLLENLLQNSVHHNKGRINIFICWDSKDKILTISDDGIGIPDKIKEHMWEPMVIADESRTGDKLRGMGLSNVKRIVELHGWNIKYDGRFRISIK